MDSDVTWKRPLPWGLILLGESSPSLPPSSLWLQIPQNFLPDCIPSSTLNAEGMVTPQLPWLQISAMWLLGGWWSLGPGECGPTAGPKVARSWPGVP